MKCEKMNERKNVIEIVPSIFYEKLFYVILSNAIKNFLGFFNDKV